MWVVFVERKATAKFLAGLLEKKGFYVTSIHGNRSQAEREAALESFRKGIYKKMRKK
jgi:superfamily II DNA/RNA helicase